jgi:hypothetical protein
MGVDATILSLAKSINRMNDLLHWSSLPLPSPLVFTLAHQFYFHFYSLTRSKFHIDVLCLIESTLTIAQIQHCLRHSIERLNYMNIIYASRAAPLFLPPHTYIIPRFFFIFISKLHKCQRMTDLYFSKQV